MVDIRRKESAKGGFPEAVLQGVHARGRHTRVVPDNTQAAYWVGVQLDLLQKRIRRTATNTPSVSGRRLLTAFVRRRYKAEANQPAAWLRKAHEALEGRKTTGKVLLIS